MIVYFNGGFMEKGRVRISPDDRGFLFGDGVYEVIRVYGGRLFRCGDHLERLARNLREIRVADPGVGALEHGAIELLERNGIGSGNAHVYIQVTRGAAPRDHLFPDGAPPTVYMSAAPAERRDGKEHAGIVLVPDIRWGRCDIKSICLLPNVLARQQAKECGADEAVFVRDGVVTEGSRTNLFALLEGRLVTHPTGTRILAGVSRKVVLELCAELGIGVEERPVSVGELDGAEEIIITGTVSEVASVVRVDGREVCGGKPGPVASRLRGAFRELTG